MASMLCKRFAKDDCGAPAVETAIIVPFVVVLLINVVGFSQMIWDYMETDFAAQMGARAAYQTCGGGTLPATSHCTGLNSAIANAVQGTSLGAGVALASGFPSEGYYCLSGTSLQYAGSYKSPPNPFTCPNAGITPADYISVNVTYQYTPIFSGLSLLPAFTMSGSALQRL